MSSSTGSTALVKGKGSSSPVDSQLTLAIADFKKTLTADQQKELERLKQVPDADSVLIFTAELDSRVQTTQKSVAGKLYPALASIRDFCAIVDTFVSSNPEIAALVWGSLRLTIFMFAASASQITALTDLFEFFKDASPRFAEYQALFPESTKLQEAVCDFHASIINCCSYLVKSIPLAWHAHLKQVIWETFTQKISRHKDEIQRRSGLVRYALEIAKLQADRQEQQFQAEERKSSKLFRKAVGASVEFQRMQLEKTERLNRAQRQSLLESLSSHDHILPWRQNRNKWQPGTLEWVFELQAFKDWMSGSGPPLMWCSGKIGSGKSILSAKVVDHLLRLKQRQISDVLVTFFFMRFDHVTSLDPETILRSLIRQTLDEASLDDYLVTQLENLRIDGFSDQERLRGFLEQRVKQFKSFFIVIDGLDECSKSQRKSLLIALSKLSACHEGLRLLLAGRESVSGSIQAEFAQISSISPYKEEDMSKFVNSTIQARRDDRDLVVGDEDLIDVISTALIEGADGMFTWVVFQIEEICLQVRDEDIRKTIKDLPRDLKGIFLRILHRISSQDRANVVRDALAWAAVAKEPLTKDQLRDALSIKIGQESLHSQKNINDIDGVISRCENLLQVDEEFGIIQFAHSSILQFLQEDDLPASLSHYHIDMTDEEHRAGEICVTYLNLNDFKTTLARRKKPSEHISPGLLAQVALTPVGTRLVPGAKVMQKLGGLGKTPNSSKKAAVYPIESLATFGRANEDTSQSLQEKHPFLQYASRWWIPHSRDFDEDKSRTWHSWYQMLTQGHELAQMPWNGRDFQPLEVEVLRWCSKYDHVAIIHCIAAHQSLTEMDKIDLAHFSAGEGHLTLFKSLLATLSKQAKSKVAQIYRVQEAADQAVSHLVAPDTEADHRFVYLTFNPVSFSKLTSRFLGESTALHAAAWGGHTRVVEILLSMGAEPSRRAFIRLPETTISSIGRLEISPLQLAIINHHLDVIKLLVRDFILPNGEFLRRDGPPDDPRPLLKIFSSTPGYPKDIAVYEMNPLHRAVYSGCSLEIINFLLESGADATDGSYSFGTPLHIAASRGDFPIFERLSQAISSIDFDKTSYYMPTEVAERIFLGNKPYQGNNPFLRRNFPRIKTDFNSRVTALEIAAMHGHQEIVRMLLAGGANSDGLDSLVHEMRLKGHLDVVDKLEAAKTMAMGYR